MPVEIWMNPSCSKCRSAKADLDAAGVEYVERRYLDDPPTPAELTGVLERLGLDPWDIARAAEAKEAGLRCPRCPDCRCCRCTDYRCRANRDLRAARLVSNPAA